MIGNFSTNNKIYKSFIKSDKIAFNGRGFIAGDQETLNTNIQSNLGWNTGFIINVLQSKNFFEFKKPKDLFLLKEIFIDRKYGGNENILKELNEYFDKK